MGYIFARSTTSPAHLLSEGNGGVNHDEGNFICEMLLLLWDRTFPQEGINLVRENEPGCINVQLPVE